MQLKDDTSVPRGTVSIEGKSNENADFTITYCFDLALALQFVMPIEIPFCFAICALFIGHDDQTIREQQTHLPKSGCIHPTSLFDQGRLELGLLQHKIQCTVGNL
jgi:hypothetical protein